MAAELSARTAHPAARYLRNNAIPGRRSRLGGRLDRSARHSKDPFIAGDEYIEWLQLRGRDPRRKRLIASDGLDVDQIIRLHAYFAGTLHNGAIPEDFQTGNDFFNKRKWTPDHRIRFSAGWGTYLTNDFRDCNPQGDVSFDPVSIVCKLSEVEGRPAVKLSDNFSKALGDSDEIERYRRLFGTMGVADLPVYT